MIAPAFLEELRTRLDLSAVVGARVALTKAGKEFKACCPFHIEKTPSFYVNDDKHLWHCFGCGAHGDAVSFVMRHDNLPFTDAIEVLAGEAGMALPEVTPEDRALAVRRRDLWHVVEAACAFYEAQLWGEGGGEARAYLLGRGVDEDTATRFRLGWAPEDGHALRRHLCHELDIPEEDAIEAGVLARGKEREGRIGAPYSFLRGRVTFPIGDAQGRVVAFGGRCLDGEEPKYLNTGETPLFVKGRRLYGQSRARQAAGKGEALIVVEGYLDVIQLVQAGFNGAVAPLGTALTYDQIDLLWRLQRDGAADPCLCFDGDKAGLRAAAKATLLALPLVGPGKSLRFAQLPEGQDPDSLMRDVGIDAFQAVLDAAKPLADQLWSLAMLEPSLERPRSFATPEQKAAVQTWVTDQLRTIADETVRDAYRAEMEGRLKAVMGARPKLKLGKPEGRAGGAPPAPLFPAPDAPESDDGPCPVLPLGSRDKSYFYLSRRGEYLELRFDKHADPGLASLFGGDVSWLIARFPKTDGNGQVTGYQLGAARNYLFRQADDMPIFAPEELLRGAGLWPDGQGGIVVHCGAMVRVGEDWVGAGRRIGNHVYPIEPSLPAPADTPGPRTDWVEYHSFLGSWNWSEPERDTLSQVGWLANAMLAGVAPWNCPLWNRGGSSAGKSTLLNLHRATLGRGWAIPVSDPTEAAVRQSLGPSARPVLIDEIEADEVNSRAAAVSKLVRTATDPNQAPIRRGSADGTAVEFPIRAVLYFTSILRPALAPQDLNRMTICELRDLPATAEARERLREALPKFARAGPRMRARLLDRWRHFPAARDAFEAALLTAGHKGRQLDQVGTLLACAFLALCDEEKPPDALAKHWAGLFPADYRVGLAKEQTEPYLCLQHLMSSAPEREWVENTNRRVTVADMINRRVMNGWATADLGAYGLGVWPHPDGGEKCVVVANNHQGLEDIFRGTRWAGGVWAQALGMLHPKTKADKLLSFKGIKQRGTWIPLGFIPDGRDAADDDDPDGRQEPSPSEGMVEAED
ncbi:DNA primase [Azospirillum doebereinerae]|uniref:DNA primase n=1 Tax=Azospirillum doebereinerae TaxID=92933 RepID=UPI001EE631C1|nr:DNA primase [Azospirillum doebereinerae]MCG5238399.1 DNA primase [Azospirillum doebereinerae]